MSGAEGQRRLDLDADAVEGNAGAVVRAVHDEAAGADRLQPREAFGHPIFRVDSLEAQRFGGGRPGRRFCQRTDGFDVRRGAEVDRYAPSALADIHKAGRHVVVWKALGKQSRDALCWLFSGFQDGN